MDTIKKESVKPSKTKLSNKSANRFPIVGIGASAGGLQALEQFFNNVPVNSGMAYVVVQHLDPTQKGMLPELLQRTTKMKVFQIKDASPVKPNCVYVIPPNKSLSILKGALYLFEPKEIRGLRLPIDIFLRSLADDQKELSIGLILSGMGSDGSIGIRAIKERNGIVLVQDPATAKFDSMPRNAIENVVADIIAPANELPVRLIDFIKVTPAVLQSDQEIEIKQKSALEKIIILLKRHTGNDFSLYKKNTLYRRIERRMVIHKIDKIAAYIPFLQKNNQEMDILFKELMIGVTNFFRDNLVWEKLQEIIISGIISRDLPPGTILRAWVAGCSTGEEAYTLAIIFKEALEKMNLHEGLSLQIFATDLDNDAIESARKGIFPANIVSDVSPERLNKFFVKTEEGYQVNSKIREMVVFAQHNIIMHPPFTKIDILCCRNLLIYMEPELQKKILGLFYISLNNDGLLVLGSSETLGSQSYLFMAEDFKLKIFKRSLTNEHLELYDFPSSFSRSKLHSIEKQVSDKTIPNIKALADQLLVEHFSPIGVLVNENGDILYISGRASKYLEPAVGKANLNIFAMLREGLRDEFPFAFRKAVKQRKIVNLSNIKVSTNGDSQIVNVNIQWIDKPVALSGTLMIIFKDVPEIHEIKEPATKGRKIVNSQGQMELEKELQDLREEMQNTHEEMQTSQEELKSTNEELQSSNEELQSTNEELTSSKEEMQSLNEELQTVNAELQTKVDEFSRVNNDMKNLLNSTDIATLFLDKELNIRRYTNQATKIFKLIKSDIGRPFTDQVSDLIYPDLTTDALEVLKTLVFIQKPIPSQDGRWFTVRIMPYRTSDDRIDGLVITFINITDLKQFELKLHETEQVSNLLLNSSPDIIIILSPDFEIMDFNPEAEKFFNKKREEVVGHHYFQMFVPENVRIEAEKNMNKIVNNLDNGKLKIQVIASNGKTPVLEWSVNTIINKLEVAVGIILTSNKMIIS